MRSVVCRSLGWSLQPGPVLDALSSELDKTYRDVAKRLSRNPDVRFETVGGRKELILTPLEKLEESASLVALRAAVAARLPRLDLPEIVMEIAARTGFTEAFTHLTERAARVADLTTSVCAVLTAEACNTGPEPFIRYDNPALRRDRLALAFDAALFVAPGRVAEPYTAGRQKADVRLSGNTSSAVSRPLLNACQI